MRRCMLKLPPTIAGTRDEVCGILLAKDSKSLLKSALFYQTVSGKIPARRVPCDEVLLREEALGSCIVSGGEMDLSKPECVFIIF